MELTIADTRIKSLVLFTDMVTGRLSLLQEDFFQ